MKKKLYGIDLDGVCFDFGGAFRGWIDNHLHIHLEEEEITSYYWYEDSRKIDKVQFMEQFHLFGRAGGYRNLEILPGTLEALNAIAADGHGLIYITNRPDYALQDTVEALEEHNFPEHNNLHFAHGAKAPLIREYGVDVFIDDSPRTIAEITANTRATVYCQDMLYNRHLDDAFFTRVHSWEEFLRHEGVGVLNG